MKEQPTYRCDQPKTTGITVHRPLSVLIFSLLSRSAHQLGAGVLVAVYLLDLLPAAPRIYFIITAVSGLLLLASEWARHRQIFREVAGVISLAKLLLIGAAFHGFLPLVETLLVTFIVASLGAHMPRTWRHRLLF